ncbi:MAG TPA: glycosyltransferase [Bacteroidia bacterium]|jgi:glycosyltransferase involved in cell wall biosynthesis|nr:glycosyltransferase [Bacteroidia bacterium]
MNPSLKISIIIPCFNQGDFLREALENISSIPGKERFEIIIVDDGSTDQPTLRYMEELQSKNYIVIHQQNKGLGAARNTGIRNASAPYILPLDCDNKIRAEYISEGIKELDGDPQTDVVYGNGEFFGEKKGAMISGEFNLQKLMTGNYIDACAIFRRSSWEKAGGYDEKMPLMGYEDWDLWLRMAFGQCRFRYIDKTLFDYRYSQRSMINSIDSGSYEKVMAYMQEKHKAYLNQAWLNHLIYHRVRQKRSLAFRLLFFSLFPRLSDYLAKRKKLKKKNVIY